MRRRWERGRRRIQNKDRAAPCLASITLNETGAYIGTGFISLGFSQCDAGTSTDLNIFNR